MELFGSVLVVGKPGSGRHTAMQALFPNGCIEADDKENGTRISLKTNFADSLESSDTKYVGIILVYDITDKGSFECCQQLIPQVQRKAEFLCIIGTHRDQATKRQVQYKQAIEMKDAIDGIWGEISPHDAMNINQLRSKIQIRTVYVVRLNHEGGVGVQNVTKSELDKHSINSGLYRVVESSSVSPLLSAVESIRSQEHKSRKQEQDSFVVSQQEDEQLDFMIDQFGNEIFAECPEPRPETPSEAAHRMRLELDALEAEEKRRLGIRPVNFQAPRPNQIRNVAARNPPKMSTWGNLTFRGQQSGQHFHAKSSTEPKQLKESQFFFDLRPEQFPNLDEVLRIQLKPAKSAIINKPIYQRPEPGPASEFTLKNDLQAQKNAVKDTRETYQLEELAESLGLSAAFVMDDVDIDAMHAKQRSILEASKVVIGDTFKTDLFTKHQKALESEQNIYVMRRQTPADLMLELEIGGNIYKIPVSAEDNAYELAKQVVTEYSLRRALVKDISMTILDKLERLEYYKEQQVCE